MKITRVTCCLFVLVLSLVAFAFTTSVPGAHAASGTNFVFRFHGLAAQAVFDSLSPDRCIDTFVFVDGSQNTVNNQTSSAADIFIGKFDICTNTQLLAASGSTLNPSFQIDKRLLSASLNTTISVTDFVSGSTFNVAVSVAWTSTSAITHVDQTLHVHSKAFTVNAHLNADLRNAGALGTVSDGTTNFTPSPSVFAQTMSAKEVDVTITHP
jgi:hypothetical protein